jgi:ADP-heptose:LPS heptosyltransferase
MYRRVAVGLYLKFIGPFLKRQKIPFTEILKSPQRILIRPPSPPGELLFALPALATIRGNYPDAELSLLVSESRMELVSAAGLADHIVAYSEPVTPFGRRFRDLKRDLRRGRFDLYLDFNKPVDRNRKLFASLGAARVRAGYSRGEDFPYLNLEIKSTDQHVDEVKRSVSMLQWIGESSRDYGNPGDYYASVADKLWLDDFLLSHSSPKEERRIIVDFSLPQARRGWGVESVGGALRGLEQLCRPRFFMFPPPEAKSKENLSGISKYVVREPVIFRDSIPRAAALMEHCDLILSSKSDLFSLAHVLGLPAILMIPENEAFFPPESESLKVLRIKRGRELPSGEIVGAAAALLKERRE